MQYIKEQCSHLLPFILHMGKYLQDRDRILADEDMIKIVEVTDQIRQMLDASRLFYALNAYAAVKVICLFFLKNNKRKYVLI